MLRSDSKFESSVNVKHQKSAIFYVTRDNDVTRVAFPSFLMFHFG